MRAVNLREAVSADRSAIESLLIANGLPTVGVADALAGFMVAEYGKEIVGVAGIEVCGGRLGLLRSTVVANAWRRRGLAGRLVEQVMANARARKLDALYLLTTTAENFFTRFGFAVTDRANVPKPIAATCEFREACPASAAVMVKSLTVPFKTV